MTDPTDADVEWMARLRCVMGGWNPDDITPAGEPVWMLFEEEAFRALNWMQANGVKMTTREPDLDAIEAMGDRAYEIRKMDLDYSTEETDMERHIAYHDAAPMTPHMAPEASQDAPKPQAGQFAPTEG